MTRTLLLVLWTALLSACGQKGPLYLPPPPAPEIAQPAPQKQEVVPPEPASTEPQGGGESPAEIHPLQNP
jgi:predicted small lipoprotein YifL